MFRTSHKCHLLHRLIENFRIALIPIAPQSVFNRDIFGMSNSETNILLTENAKKQINEIAKHYNEKGETDIAERSKSKILFMRNFNNWIKSILINNIMSKIRTNHTSSNNNNNNNRSLNFFRPSVLDLGCGKGGDMRKWEKAGVSHVTFADIADVSLQECENRYSEKHQPFKAKFVHLDATKELLSEKLDPNKDQLEHDLVSSQFVIHYSFESFEQADTFLKNVSDCLKVGGFFIGSTTNAYELVKRLRQSSDHSFGNEIYKITFDASQDKDNIDLFGVKFDFHLDSVVNCPEYLLNFDVLIKLASKHNLKLVFKKTFAEFFDDNSKVGQNKELISIMRALEPYYPKEMDQSSEQESEENGENRCMKEYAFIESLLADDAFKNDLQPNETYATLSKSEWEAITLYMAFAFEKIQETNEPSPESSLKRKLSE